MTKIRYLPSEFSGIEKLMREKPDPIISQEQALLLQEKRLSQPHTGMYHLHFHEGKQAFCIIPTGVTITEAHDGVLIISSPSHMFLRAIAIGVNMVAKKFALVYTIDDIKEMITHNELNEIGSLIRLKDE